MDLISKLYREHAAILDLAQTLRKMIDRHTPPERSAFFELKLSLSRQLIAHLTSEDLLIYPRLCKNADPHIAQIAMRFVDELGGLRESVKEWSAYWSYDRAVAAWPAFRSVTGQLLAKLTARIERENRELYPLAAAAA